MSEPPPSRREPTTSSPADFGPVSAALQAELTQEVQRHSIVVWLDKDGSYNGFVDKLAEMHQAGQYPYPVVAFRGSFLETLFALADHGSGYDRQSLIVHMPGYNEDSIRTTPMLELYAAGTRFRKGLDTLIRQAATGRVLPGRVDEFLATKPTLETADDWLAGAIVDRGAGLEKLLEAGGPTLLVEAWARKDSALASLVKPDQDLGTLQNYLHKLIGTDASWFRFVLRAESDTPQLEPVLSAASAWALCVEYVHDLRREPYLEGLKRLRLLSKPLVKSCTDLLAKLRQSYPEAYETLADEAESMLDQELRAMSPEDLGQIDTFREEENRVLRGAVEVLQTGDWPKAETWCRARAGDKSFWLKRDPVRRRTWNLVSEAARFGQTLTEHARPFDRLTSFDDALERYSTTAALVDRAHRRFEQQWLRCLDTQMPHFGALQEVLGTLRQMYRAWADRLAKDFTRLCKAEGFLPPSHLQQRTLYEQVIQPMAFDQEKVAVFLVDAFRYEMATELLEEFRASGSGAQVDLKARLAELPTITSVGMNALAPVAKDGRLTVAGTLDGFQSGEYTVRQPLDRARAMGLRTGGNPAPHLTLHDVCEAQFETLRRKVKDHRVVVVSSPDIDKAGEANVGLLTFEALLGQIKAAWHHLQSAGIKHAVFTADHGFLLQDSTTQVRPFGKKTDPDPRYVLDTHERNETGLVPVALSKLGYDNITGYLLLAEDTSVFATKTRGQSFVHGGNSPQERIIPVLTVTRKRLETASLAEYAVEAEPLDDVLNLHRLRLRLVLAHDSQTSLGFVGARDIDLDLRVPDRKDIRLTIKEVAGKGTLEKGHVRTPVTDQWTEVFFTLQGPSDERVRVQVHHGDNIEKVRPCEVSAWYEVAGLGQAPQKLDPAHRNEDDDTWAEAIEDENVRKIFVHIKKHGSITETEIMTQLGGARPARRFALQFDQWVSRLPFGVRSESGASGKRYVREGAK